MESLSSEKCTLPSCAPEGSMKRVPSISSDFKMKPQNNQLLLIDISKLPEITELSKSNDDISWIKSAVVCTKSLGE